MVNRLKVKDPNGGGYWIHDFNMDWFTIC